MTKRGREADQGVDIHELLSKLTALSLVVEAEIPHVLESNVRVPESFGSPRKREKKAKRVTFQDLA